MKVTIRKVKIEELCEILAVLTLLFSSGGNPLIRNIVFFIVSVTALFMIKRKMSNTNLLVAVFFIAFVWFDSCVVNIAPTDYKECILLTIRMLGCAIVASSMSIERFKTIFVWCMAILSMISLVFFALMLGGIDVPGAVNVEIWHGNFFHSAGFGYDLGTIKRIRNCGIFWEPGVFQIYLNTSLLFLLSVKRIANKTKRFLLVLFSITLLSTFSSMGYIIFALVICMYVINQPSFIFENISVNKLSIMAFVLCMGACAILIEMFSGIFTEFIRTTNSYASRHDDTILTFLIARDNPIVGVGLATNLTPIWDIYFEQYDSLILHKAYQNALSCGLGNYAAQGGLIFASVYITVLVKRYWKFVDVNCRTTKIILAVIVFLISIEEPILPVPFFLLAFVRYIED